MLKPTKYENLDKNIMVVGARILNTLKATALNVDQVYRLLNKDESVSFDKYFDALTFLYALNFIEPNGPLIVSKQQK